ncbi:hypothetical protein LPTSP4_21600 [Leptospira ryugenii]|uniref:Tetratricopeptide repeat protein n=1 Tax=Leptospira ryugenii TaxID=1917863 RepID=A0A2P2E186_9LEPT|nr:hypothetical protein [Leptospira ryugenii]GBF50634.1 hypothetical protein LPTSP4_21600 [Leptospira ryugenii]
MEKLAEEDQIVRLWRKWKWLFFLILLAIQGGIYQCAQSRLSHPSISPNQAGMRLYLSNTFPEAEEKFTESISFGFRTHIPLFNLALSLAKQSKYQDSHELTESIQSQNWFFWEAYHLDGHNLFFWGKSVLNEKDCDYQETIVLWEAARGKLFRSSIFSLLQLNLTMSMESQTTMAEVAKHIKALPAWRENCLNPPKKGEGGGEGEGAASNAENSSNHQTSSDPKGKEQNSKDSKDNPKQKSNGQKDSDTNEDRKDKNSDVAKGDNPSDSKDGNQQSQKSKSEIEKKKEELSTKREEKRNQNSLGTEERKKINESASDLYNSDPEKGYWNRDYYRHIQEIPLRAKGEDLEKAMKEAKP